MSIRTKCEVRHDCLVQKLFNILKNSQRYETVDRNIDYALGECDVLARNKDCELYYEVKSKHHVTGLNKAIRQLVRWSAYEHNQNKRKDYIGVYVGGHRGELEKVVEICRNGQLSNPNELNDCLSNIGNYGRR